MLLLPAKAEVEDRIRGLESGADDYLPKPFDMSELLARVRAAVPEILLLDETFHGLAPEDERAMRAALERMLPRVPVLVWVTHNEASAPRWLGRSLRLRGRS